MFNTHVVYPADYPITLREMVKPPKYLNMVGSFPDKSYKYLCVIGARNNSEYGKKACYDLILGLKGQKIAIVSGLAYGIDSIAHEAALSANLKTIAFPGSGLDEKVLYPQEKIPLAHKIIEAGGAIASPFPSWQTADHWTFPARNKIMAGLSHAVLVIEGCKGSGTLFTANYALDESRDVLAVPGSIYSELSYGPNLLITDRAHPVTTSEQILSLFGLYDFTDLNEKPRKKNEQACPPAPFEVDLNPVEIKIVETMDSPVTREDIIRLSELSAREVNIALTELQIKGAVLQNGDMFSKANIYYSK